MFNLEVQKIRNFYLSVFLPVFSKYNYNVIHRPQHKHQRVFLENKYRQILLCLVQVFQMMNLFLIQHILKSDFKVWRHGQELLTNPTCALSTCVIGMLQL